MDTAAAMVGAARAAAGLTQRELGRLARVPQASISRIEQGEVTPRTTTLLRLLRACGWTLEARPMSRDDVDRSLIRERLALSPGERSRLGVDEARAFLRLTGARLRRRAS